MGKDSREYSEEIIKQFVCTKFDGNPTLSNFARKFKKSVEPTATAGNITQFVGTVRSLFSNTSK